MFTVIDRRALLGASALAVTAVLPRSARGQNVKPATPTTPMPSIEAYARTPTIDSIALSPDGKRAALVTQNGDDKILVFYDLDDISRSILKLARKRCVICSGEGQDHWETIASARVTMMQASVDFLMKHNPA